MSKQDQRAHVIDHKLPYFKLVDAGQAIVGFLKGKGYQAVSPLPNIEYREDMPYMAMVAPLSHRYVAIASGLGWFGWSGNPDCTRIRGGCIPFNRRNLGPAGTESNDGRRRLLP